MRFILLAPGPSLNYKDLNYITSDDTLIYINGAIRIRNKLKEGIVYSSDPKWYRVENPDPSLFTEMLCPFYTNGIATLIPGRRGTGITLNNLKLGSSSGYAAVNLAALMGASVIHLHGYDMGKKNNKAHFFGDYSEALHKNSPYEKFIKDFEGAREQLEKLNIEVYNLTPDSNLKEFKTQDNNNEKKLQELRGAYESL